MKKPFIIISILIVVSLIVSFSGITIVDTGHRGVKTHFGEVISESLQEGIYFYNPFTMDVVQMDTRTLRNDGSTTAYTKDVQQAQITFTVNYHLEPSKAHTIFKTVGVDWEEKLVPQIVQGNIKSIIGQWEAVDLVENRQKATLAIFDATRAALEIKGVTVENFELTNIDYSDDFEKAVEAKVTAIQRASEAQNKTRQVEEEAKQRIISAKAEAESMRIKNESLAQNRALIEYEAVLKWDGKLPQYSLGGAIPFINVPHDK